MNSVFVHKWASFSTPAGDYCRELPGANADRFLHSPRIPFPSNWVGFRNHHRPCRICVPPTPSLLQKCPCAGDIMPANWSLPYALVVRLDPDVPLSFWLTHTDTLPHTRMYSLSPFHHTPVEIRGLWELPLHFVFSYCRWRPFSRASTVKGCLVAEVIMVDVLFPLLRLSGMYSGY